MVDRGDHALRVGFNEKRSVPDNLSVLQSHLRDFKDCIKYFESFIVTRREEKGGWFNKNKLVTKTIVDEDNKKAILQYVKGLIENISWYLRFLEKQGVDQSSEEYRSLGVIEGDLRSVYFEVEKLKSANKSDPNMTVQRNKLKNRIQSSVSSLSVYINQSLNAQRNMKKSA